MLDARGNLISSTRPESDTLEGCLVHVLRLLGEQPDVPAIAVAGHRIVHGGDEFRQPVILDDEVLHRLRKLVPLAPLHQPVNLDLAEICRAALPDIPHVACFDTTFHQGQDELVRQYALPRDLTEKGIHRFGFHGTSFESVLRQWQRSCPERAGDPIVIAHLGSGSSLCAIKDGRSVATTMGFSTADGLPMGTRCGSIDPGVLIYLLRQYRMSADALEDLLYRRSGLLGISAVSGSMRTLRQSGEPAAAAAIDYFVYRCAREIGSLVAALGGLSGLVFTGGIGENDAATRREIAVRCGWLGMKVEDRANESGSCLISSAESRVGVYVIPSDEEMMIAVHAQRLSCARPSGN